MAGAGQRREIEQRERAVGPGRGIGQLRRADRRRLQRGARGGRIRRSANMRCQAQRRAAAGT
eukprot:153995-Prymnesium_polylepis.1